MGLSSFKANLTPLPLVASVAVGEASVQQIAHSLLPNSLLPNSLPPIPYSAYP
ncbi:MAG: hypothetical protein AAFU53_06140 [Cyanobacteria bacterium J06632_3]